MYWRTTKRFVSKYKYLCKSCVGVNFVIIFGPRREHSILWSTTRTSGGITVDFNSRIFSRFPNQIIQKCLLINSSFPCQSHTKMAVPFHFFLCVRIKNTGHSHLLCHGKCGFYGFSHIALPLIAFPDAQHFHLQKWPPLPFQLFLQRKAFSVQLFHQPESAPETENADNAAKKAQHRHGRNWKPQSKMKTWNSTGTC